MERIGRLAFAAVLLLPVFIITFIVYSLNPEADDPLQGGSSQDSFLPSSSSAIYLPNRTRVCPHLRGSAWAWGLVQRRLVDGELSNAALWAS